MSVRPLQSFWMIFSSLCKTIAFQTVRLIFSAGQSITWRITGVHQRIQNSKDPNNPVGSAQVLKILSWNKFCLLRPTEMKHFICMHQEFVKPEYVMEHDHVLLFFIGEKTDEAVFCEGLPGQLLWKSDYSSFVHLAALAHGKKLIRMPMRVFHELADKMPDPQAGIVLITNTARCGSTLMTQLFDMTERIISLSEPHILNNAAIMYHEQGMSEEVLRFTRNAMRMLCKPLKSIPDPVAYAMKPTGPSTDVMYPIKQLFPKVTTLYLYRDMEKVSTSLYRLSWILPTVRIAYLMFRISPKLVVQGYKDASLPLPPTKIEKLDDDFTSGVFQAIATTVYHKLKESPDIHGILFDDIIKNPELATRPIFKLCDIPMELLELALKAFEVDSQRNTPVSKERMARVPQLEVAEEDRVRANALLIRCKYPPLNQGVHLEGTVNFNEVLKEDK